MSQDYRYSLPERPGDNRLLGQLTGSACALECAQISERHTGPILLIAPDMQNALRLRDEIQQFTDNKVLSIADWETLPYDSFSPHQEQVEQDLDCMSVNLLLNLMVAKYGLQIMRMEKVQHFHLVYHCT